MAIETNELKKKKNTFLKIGNLYINLFMIKHETYLLYRHVYNILKSSFNMNND